MERVTENAARRRYEIFVDDELVGFTQYRDRASTREIFHTEVFEGFEGRGLGTTMLRGALDDIRAQELRLEATCPMLVKYLEQHPDDRDLLGPGA